MMFSISGISKIFSASGESAAASRLPKYAEPPG